jgi:hypothetical protein
VFAAAEPRQPGLSLTTIATVNQPIAMAVRNTGDDTLSRSGRAGSARSVTALST